jgi:hypothetical protein
MVAERLLIPIGPVSATLLKVAIPAEAEIATVPLRVAPEEVRVTVCVD